MRNKLTMMLIVVSTLFPFMAQADIVSLQPTPVITPAPTSPLSCFNFNGALKMNNKSYGVRGLQFALIHEGSTISASEYGMFGSDTLVAVKKLQTKYGLTADGIVGKMVNSKLNALYGCGAAVTAMNYPSGCTSTTAFSATNGLPCIINTTNISSAIPSKVSLSVKSVTLDNNGVTGVFCNNGLTDIPLFPVRLRLNGIVRDFNVL